MTRRFCVVCGKATDELIHSVCVDCFKKEKAILRMPKKLGAEVCRSCGARKQREKWIETGTAEDDAVLKAAEEALHDSIIVEGEDTEIKIDLLDLRRQSERAFLVKHNVSVRGTVEGVVLSSEGTSNVTVRTVVCDDCNRMRSGYFEAVLQVRGEGELDKETRRKAADTVIDAMRGGGKREFVSKIEDLKEGIDYYVGSVKAAKKLARVLQQKFGGRVSESAKLFGVKEGRDLYRVTIAVRLPRKH